METTTVEALMLGPNGWVPNNPYLPVLIYRSALTARAPDGTARRFEMIVGGNGWPAQWRNGVYDFDHYHSTAHEVLGVAAGSARLALGGPEARIVAVTAGDVLLLPAGTGHCRIEASRDFLVVGAYPAGQSLDICRQHPTEAMRRTIAGLPFPGRDPVFGAGGPLVRHWRVAGTRCEPVSDDRRHGREARR
jgi:uncharacterized protein YjlB